MIVGPRNIHGREYGLIKLLLSKDTKPGSRYSRVAKKVGRSAETIRIIALTRSFNEFKARKQRVLYLRSELKANRELLSGIAKRIKENEARKVRNMVLVAVLLIAIVIVYIVLG